jgi:hypothetical protein
MRAFVSGEGDGAEFEELGREASRGNALSEVAIDERDERL